MDKCVCELAFIAACSFQFVGSVFSVLKYCHNVDKTVALKLKGPDIDHGEAVAGDNENSTNYDVIAEATPENRRNAYEETILMWLVWYTLPWDFCSTFVLYLQIGLGK